MTTNVKVPKQYIDRCYELIGIVEKIWSQPEIHFEFLVPSNLEILGAVYAIGIRGTDQILYVGRTKNLQRRLYTNHLMGNESTARLKKYLTKDELLTAFAVTVEKMLPEPEDIRYKKEAYQLAKDYIRNHCYFKFLPLDESRLRGLTEAGLTFAFNTKFLEEEH
ncbi:GIY-YIG nuclease family protein [Paenibacillus sp. 2TAB26]|uniref:GIY-YIG nuclease family protein n=1 Tax=Paenibacillus sp. 2TAB26 TaxID=3233005 RepID=UPI003F961562